MKTSDSDRVKEEIITASEIVFERYGFLRVSMQDISKECKKGRSTLYHYFKNKDEVLDAVCYKLFSHCLDESKAAISKRRSFSSNLEAFNDVKIKRIREMVLKYKLLVDDMKQDPSLLILKSRAMAEDEIVAIKTIIAWGVENKEIAELTEEDTEFLAETLSAVFKGFEQEIILFGRFPQFETKIAWLAQLLHKGLR